VAQQLSLHTVAQRCTRLLGHRVTPQYLSNLEHDYRQPSLRVLRVLATVLTLDPTTLGMVLFEGPALPRLPRASTPPTAEEILGRVRQATHHLHETQQHYRALLRSAHQAGASLRQLATVTGLSPSRMQQLVHPSRSRPPARRVERQDAED
jgi:transcriptional regulator with XRE-family HTH domain